MRSVCRKARVFPMSSDEEMKRIMKAAVNAMYRLLWQRGHDPEAYLKSLGFGERYTPPVGRSRDRDTAPTVTIHPTKESLKNVQGTCTPSCVIALC